MEESARVDFARMEQVDEGVSTVTESKTEMESDCKGFEEWRCCIGF